MYINPVEAGLVFRGENYRCSSAIDYAHGQGLLDGIVVFRMFFLAFKVATRSNRAAAGGKIALIMWETKLSVLRLIKP